ncbi:MarR family transcriptional regulator [Frankia sp. CNm7]|uniref:MarR family transcriptional regulator n=1 Tax=Frankia nepalensis TaxID=1836974 RepID=A0A937RDS9_9ACTN|nr:MarR family transcriptional regulator [Frankia nepalensis]MBL7502124.1 MarR family transcriptional regulator [Frankia nepalensis]MBL7512905.1 MarR family transcriptional regulator [Frankia nepalensis]MBL7524908.1 MarR family transcriptional regulator [Frankia nepalensis]MBL7628092.1 MarR family transcriptional regulator [Frankia nepalensis]
MTSFSPSPSSARPSRTHAGVGARPRLAHDLPMAARDGVAGQLAQEVVEAARLLWATVGAEKPTALPAAFEKLRPRHIQLLRLLAQRPGISVRAAAEALSMRPHNLSTLLTDLVDAGLVERLGDPRDRRIARLYLSDGTREEVESVERELQGAVVEALARLTDVDQGRIRSALPALRRLIAGLTPPTEPSPGERR